MSAGGGQVNARPERLGRAAFVHFRAIPTRWHDNDVYGHVNNVVYYGWFDTAVNGWLMENGLLDPAASPVIALVAATECSYFESVSFPETVTVGLAVEVMGRSSVTYSLGIFRDGAQLVAAQGRFTHVHVERATQKPTAIPHAARLAMERLRRM